MRQHDAEQRAKWEMYKTKGETREAGREENFTQHWGSKQTAHSCSEKKENKKGVTGESGRTEVFKMQLQKRHWNGDDEVSSGKCVRRKEAGGAEDG